MPARRSAPPTTGSARLCSTRRVGRDDAGRGRDRLLDLGALSVAAMTRVGLVSPLGKWAASVSYPLTDSAWTRNCSVCDRPIGVASSPVHSSAKAADRRPPRPEPAACHRVGDPVPDPAVGEGVSRRAAGRTARTASRPNRASSGGSTSSTNTAATTRPAAACTPRLRVLGDDASSRVSSASTTVALLAMMAGPGLADGDPQRVAVDLGAAQLFSVARDQQQGIVGARAEHQHAGDARRRAVRRHPDRVGDRRTRRRRRPGRRTPITSERHQPQHRGAVGERSAAVPPPRR